MSKPTAIALDVLLVVVFAIIGRASHREPLTVQGIITTAWPFLVGCLVGWVIIHTMLRRLPLLSQGGVIIVDTLILGLLLRLASGQSASWPFPAIAALALIIFLGGWRLVVWGLQRRRRPRR